MLRRTAINTVRRRAWPVDQGERASAVGTDLFTRAGWNRPTGSGYTGRSKEPSAAIRIRTIHIEAC